MSITDLSELIEKIGGLSFKQGSQIFGEDAFEYFQPLTEEEAIASIRKKYIGDEIPFRFANEGLSYSNRMGRVCVYKNENITTLTQNQLRELVDVLLMSIHWQGFRINDDKVMEAICKQHEDKPNWGKYWSGKNPAGRAHQRILKLFEDEKCLRYLKVLQGRAARGDSTPEV